MQEEQGYIPTKEQIEKIEELKRQAYSWNKDKSMSAAGVVVEKGEDLWFFGLQGEILHNPKGVSIKI